MRDAQPVFYGKPLTFNPASHRYTHGGKHLRSVTTIINRLAKPALIQWAADCAVDHVEEAFKQQGPEFVLKPFDQVCMEARTAHERIRDSAGDVGTTLHKLARHLSQTGVVDQLLLDSVPPEQKGPVLRCLDGLLAWNKSTYLGPAEVERYVVSEAHGYAGTCDRWGEIDGRLCVLDYKTGGRRIYAETWLQLAAYEIALREELGEQVNDRAIWHYAIHLDKQTGLVTPTIREPHETPLWKEAWMRLAAFDRTFMAIPAAHRK